MEPSMNPAGLAAMRKAAALAFAVPGLEVDVVHEGRTVARIERRFAADTVPNWTTLLSPCAFRMAVGRATAHCASGGKAVFLGLDPDAQPELRYMMPFAGAVRPLGVVVARVDETVAHAFATTQPELAVSAVLVEPRFRDLPDDLSIQTAWDPVT